MFVLKKDKYYGFEGGRVCWLWTRTAVLALESGTCFLLRKDTCCDFAEGQCLGFEDGRYSSTNAYGNGAPGRTIGECLTEVRQKPDKSLMKSDRKLTDM